MTTTTMTSYERVEAAFDRKDHDRVPRHDTYWRETVERWQKEGGVSDAHDVLLNHLGSDMKGVAGSWPAPFPGHQKQISEDETTRTFENDWGEIVRYFKGRSGTPEHLGWGCQTREQWEERYLPVYQDLVPPLNVDETKKAYDQARAQNKWVFLTGLESFESTRHLMGDEMAMINMAEEPEFVEEVSRVYTDAVLRGLDRIMDIGIKPDGLWVYGDMAYNHATMCSPAMYDELIWPDHKRLADWAHQHGMRFIFHTDGDVNGVMDLYLKAGFDALQPLEAKANMDIRNLCPNYGNKMLFFGNIDIMVLATNDRAAIEYEVVSKLQAGKETKGYIYHSDHSVPPQVSWETYQFVIELLEKHGYYD
jgi:uroporphyrinogen decarboxylase